MEMKKMNKAKESKKGVMGKSKAHKRRSEYSSDNKGRKRIDKKEAQRRGSDFRVNVYY